MCVITADIPLASDVLDKRAASRLNQAPIFTPDQFRDSGDAGDSRSTTGAMVLTPRGERYTENNIKQRLQMRDFMETMRSSGEHTHHTAAHQL